LPTIDSDSALIEALQFTQEETADLIGKTRQAVNSGITTKTHYFKGPEVLALMLRARQLGRVFNSQAIYEHVAR